VHLHTRVCRRLPPADWYKLQLVYKNFAPSLSLHGRVYTRLMRNKLGLLAMKDDSDDKLIEDLLNVSRGPAAGRHLQE